MDSCIRNGLALVALAFLLSGCGAQGFTLAPVAAPDSTRYVGASDSATLLVWANGSVDLWINAGVQKESGFPATTCTYRASVVYGGTYTGQDTLTIPVVTSAGDSVASGWARLVHSAAGDTVSLLADAVLVGPCGAAEWQAPVTLVRAP